MKIILVLLGLVLGSFATAAHAGKYVAPGHHEYHWWYQQIQKELGVTGCCDDNLQDCGPVERYVDLGESGVKVILEDGKEHLANPSRKFYVSTPDGRAHICRQPQTNMFGYPSGDFSFYCVFLPITGM